MSEARDDILAGIRRALRRGPLPEATAAELALRVAGRRRNQIPARARALAPAPLLHSNNARASTKQTK